MNLHTTLNYPLRADIDGNTFDYLATVDGFGCIHEVRCTFFELPEAVQQLTLGKAGPDIYLKIRNRGAIFQYELVMTLAGHLQGANNPVWELALAVAQRLWDAGTTWENLSAYYSIPGVIQWWRMCLGIAKSEIHPQTQAQFVPAVLNVLRNDGNSNNRHADIEFFGKYGGIAGQEIIINLLPFWGELEKEIGYLILSKHRSQAFLESLLQSLQLLKGPQNAEHILRTLLAFPPNQKIKTVVVNCFKQWFGNYPTYVFEGYIDSILELFSKLLAHYPDEEVTEILLHIVRYFHGYSCETAAEILLRDQYPQQVFLQEVLPVLLNDYTPPAQRHAAFKTLLSFSETHLPEGTVLWQIFFKLSNTRYPVITEMAMLLSKIKDADLDYNLLKGLTHDNDGVQYSTLRLTKVLMNKSAYLPKYRIRTAIYQLFPKSADNVKVFIVSDFTTLPFGEEPPPNFLSSLLSLYHARQPHEELFKERILTMLERYFAEFDYSSDVESICLSVIESETPESHKMLALKILQQSRNPTIVDTLQHLQAHTDSNTTANGHHQGEPSGQYTYTTLFTQMVEEDGKKNAEEWKRLLELPPPIP